MKTENQNQNGQGSPSDAKQKTDIVAGNTLRNFEEVVQSNRHKLYGMLYNMLHNHQDTEDLLQDTLHKAYKGLVKFRGDSSMETWLHGIAYNTALNLIRKRKNKYILSIDDTENNGLEYDNDYLDRTTGEAVDKQYMINELKVELENAINKLPEKHQVIVRSFDIDGDSHGEIAKRLGINENTVRSRLFYAHKKLQVLLAEYKELI